MNLFSPASWYFVDGQNAVVKNNKIIFLRHEDTAGTYKFDIYDLQTKTWSIGVLPVNVTGASIISVNNNIYVAGVYVNNVLSDKVYELDF